MGVKPHSSPCLPASAPCPTGTPRPAPGDGHSDTRAGLAEKAEAEGASERGSNVWAAGQLQAACVARTGFLPRVNRSGYSGRCSNSCCPRRSPLQGGTAVCSGLGLLGWPRASRQSPPTARA